MQLKDLPADIRHDIDSAVVRLYTEAGVNTYAELSQLLRLVARDVCRRDGQDVTDAREKEFFVKPLNIWDVRRGLDDPVEHKAATQDTFKVVGLQGALTKVADTLERYFEAQGEEIPPTCERAHLLSRNRSLRSQIHANGGECSFRIRWEDPHGHAHIAIVNIGRYEDE